MTDMSVGLGSLRLRNPVVAASGFFGYGEEYAAFFDIAKLGAFTTAPVGLSGRDGAGPLRLVETPSGVLRARDLGRLSVSRFVSEKLPFLAGAHGRGLCVIVHLQEEEPAGILRLVSLLDEHPSIAAYEIAMTCGEEGAARLRAARSVTTRPLVARLPAVFPRIEDLARAARDAGADIISLIEAVPGLVVSLESQSSTLGANAGLLSGPAIRPIALHCVREVASAVEMPIIGMGGIASASDALEFLIAGADAVAIASAIMANPRTPLEILEGLDDYCSSRCAEQIADLTGRMGG